MLVWIALAITLSGCKRRIVSVEEIDKMIKEQAPVGCDKQQVKTFIDNLKVDSLKIGRDEDFHAARREAFEGTDPDKLAKWGDKIAMYIGAVIYHSQTDPISSDDIIIRFFLDKDGKVIDYSVKELGSD
jgi:hypothetical protein